MAISSDFYQQRYQKLSVSGMKVNTDSDPALKVNADPEAACQVKTDQDPVFCMTKLNILKQFDAKSLGFGHKMVFNIN